MILNGLGLHPALYQTFDPTVVKPSTAGGGTAYREPTGPVGWTRWGFDRVKSDWEQRLATRIAMTQADLAHRYGDQMQEAAVLYGESDGKYLCYWAPKKGYAGLLYPPGVIVHMGVPMPTDAVAQKKIEIEYIPNEEQQLEADLAIYVESQRLISCTLTVGDRDPDDYASATWERVFFDPLDLYARARGQTGCNDLSGNNDIWLDLVVPTRGLQLSINKSNESIDQFRKKFIGGNAQPPTWYLDGYGHNPIAPTDEERSEPGGLKAYYERGGFLLFPDLAEGKKWVTALYSKQSALVNGAAQFSWGEGYFLCGGLPAMSMNGSSGAGEGWKTYVTVGPGGYVLRLEQAEEGWSGKLVNKLLQGVAALWGTLCQNQGTANKVATDTLTNELCQDASGQRCAKGSPGCTCTKPTSTQVASKDIWTAALQIACSQWNQAMLPSPDGPTLFTPPPPNVIVVEPPKLTPTMLAIIAALGLGAGALLARRK